MELPGIRDVDEDQRGMFKILDIGPAEGIIPRALKILGFDVFVLEHSLCSQGMDKTTYYGQLKFKECQIEKGNFPFDDNFFHLVISFGVMEHIEPPTCDFWQEVKRIVSSGGHIFIDNPQSMNLRKRISMILGVNPNNEISAWYAQKPIFTGHYREHTLDELKYCAEETGLSLVESGGIQFIAEGHLSDTQSVMKKCMIRFYMFICLFSNKLKDTLYVYCRKN
jgi:2-polyprenyl-3-methyl-5-hydroxy-6-metoxy-1,4-benzoquinol methylase